MADAGNINDLYDASSYVFIENRQGLKIGCIKKLHTTKNGFQRKIFKNLLSNMQIEYAY